MKTHPLVAELFHGDGRTDEQTDITKLIVALRNFAVGPKIPRHVRRSCINTDVLYFDTGICIDGVCEWRIWSVIKGLEDTQEIRSDFPRDSLIFIGL